MESEVKEWITKSAASVAIPYEEVLKFFEEEFKKQQKIHPNASQEQWLNLTKRRTTVYFSGQAVKGSISFVGIPLYISQIRDSNNKRYLEAINLYNEKGDSVIFDADKNPSGVVTIKDGKPVPVDNRKFWDKENSKENKRFGSDLSPHRYQQTIYGIAYPEKSPRDARRFSLRITSQNKTEKIFNPPIFKKIMFQCFNKTEDGSPDYALSTHRNTKYTELEGKTDIYKLIKEYYKDRIVELPSVYELAMGNQGKFDNFIFVEGYINDVDYTRTTQSGLYRANIAVDLENIYTPEQHKKHLLFSP